MSLEIINLCHVTHKKSVLKKKASITACHFIREGVSKNEWRTNRPNTCLDPLEMCTKSLLRDEKRTEFNGNLVII